MKLDRFTGACAVVPCVLVLLTSMTCSAVCKEGLLVRVHDRNVVDEAAEIHSKPYQVKHRSHVFRALEAGAEYVETDSVLGDAFMIPLHDNGVKTIYRCTNIVDVQAAVDLGAKYIRTGDPESVRRELSRLEGTRSRPLKCKEFRIRDPYVFVDPVTKTYYMYETKSPYFGEPYARGVNVRTSRDLVTWSPLKEVMSVPTNLHCRTVWAPEVHEYKGAYYLFTTLSFYPTPHDDVPVLSDDPEWKPKDNIAMCRRGTWVYKADRPDGEFRPVTDGSVTPRNWMSLDGSLLVDEGKPYMVFCHEWTQIKYGRIDIARMSDDLSRLVEEPKVLFDSRVVGPAGGHVTDGCFCYRSPKTGRLFMIWSTFYNRGYTVFSCESKSGHAYGPWTDQKPIFEKNGGHGMIFRTFDGGLKLVLHQPERRGYERVAFFDVIDGEDGLAVVAATPVRVSLDAKAKEQAQWRDRLVQVKSTLDGTDQPCYFWAPDKAAKEAVPLIVGLHTWSANYLQLSHYQTVLSYAQKAGWAFVGPNFRGPNSTPEGCGSDLAVQDIVDAVNYAKGRVKIDASRVYIIGGSGGGHMTLLMLGRHPEVFAAGAAFCPITDVARWHADSLEKHPGRGKGYARMLESACGGTPAEKPEQYRHRSPLTWLARAKEQKVPAYICTGIHDGWTGSVPVGHSIRGFNALADEKDRLTEEEIAFLEANQSVPPNLVASCKDPFYGTKNRVHFRRTSGLARLTLFEGGHGGNFQAGFDFLSRQRKGTPVDWSLPKSASGDYRALGR